MSEFEYDLIKFLRFKLDLEKKATAIISQLNAEFVKKEFVVDSVSANSLVFKFWGLGFITKTEFVVDEKNFKNVQAELNTYMIKDDKLIEINSVTFDVDGNIGYKYTISDFADVYYINFINKLLDFAKKEEIKFQL